MEDLRVEKYEVLKVNIEYYFIFVLTLLLSIIGIIIVASSSVAVGERLFNDPYWFIKREIAWWLISFILFIVISRINFRFIAKFSNFLVLISLGLLALVLIPGFSVEVGGSKRWLDLPFFNPQPSEIAKLFLIIFVCYSLSRKYKDDPRIKNLLWPSLVVLFVASFLIFLEPDMGTVIVIWAAIFIVFFIGNVKLGHIIAIFFMTGIVLTAYLFMEEYRRQRIFAFLDKTGDPASNFQLNQSLIALGSGNITGVGLGNSVQKYSYLPEAHTDFVFAILGEEFGLVGTLVVVLLFVLLTFFGIRVVLRTKDYFGRTLAAGLTGLIAVQAIINISVVTGLLPVTGLTLPFLSSGGSSLMTSMVSVGILLNISRQNLVELKKVDAEAVVQR